jgi:hypothetical protein
MENSAITRQATRARIGPWYIMQSRNPSAPGMKFNTLLALIRKSQITPRSVIRGPTTFQLWRFAARVKGISREFGLCYSCGAELQRTSTFCPRCSRSQELPPNPDVLLETEPQPAKPVYREVTARPATPGEVVPDSQQSAAARPPQPPEPEPIRTTRAPTQIPSAAETMAELAEIPSPHNAPAELQSRPRQRPKEGVLTPRELAAAFSLQYDPNMDAPGTPRRRSHWKGLLAALLLLAVGAAASTFYFVPSLRLSFLAWLQDSPPPGATGSSVTQSTLQKPLPDPTPDWMTTVPSPPIATPPKTPASGSSVASNDLTPNNPPAPPAKSAPPANIVPVPMPSSDTPAASPAPVDPRTAIAAETAEKLRASAGGDLDTLAMQLYRNGLDADSRKDYAAALYYYQQVETLPRDHWPSDIDLRLKDVQKRLAAVP